MAIHTQLPIYKVAYNLLSVAVDYVQNMSRPVINPKIAHLSYFLLI